MITATPTKQAQMAYATGSPGRGMEIQDKPENH
jgi:hypothetical protein